MSVVSKLARQHEDDLAEAFGGRRSPGSGNQFANQMDGRTSHYERPFGFAWDGKCTRGKSIGITREMWDKAIEQAHGERPMLAFRFYDDDRGRGFTDLVAVALDDFIEMLQTIEAMKDAQSKVDEILSITRSYEYDEYNPTNELGDFRRRVLEVVRRHA